MLFEGEGVDDEGVSGEEMARELGDGRRGGGGDGEDAP